MTDASNLRHLRYGAHSAATEWTTTPTMSTFLEPENAPQFDVRPRHRIDAVAKQSPLGQRVDITRIEGSKRSVAELGRLAGQPGTRRRDVSDVSHVPIEHEPGRIRRADARAG